MTSSRSSGEGRLLGDSIRHCAVGSFILFSFKISFFLKAGRHVSSESDTFGAFSELGVLQSIAQQSSLPFSYTMTVRIYNG